MSVERLVNVLRQLQTEMTSMVRCATILVKINELKEHGDIDDALAHPLRRLVFYLARNDLKEHSRHPQLDELLRSTKGGWCSWS